MKKLLTLIACAALALCLMLPSAMAAALLNDAQAYTDAAGRAVLHENGRDTTIVPVNNVRDIVYMAGENIFLTAQNDDGDLALYGWSPLLSTDSGVEIALISGDAVYVPSDDRIYFANGDNPRVLMSINPANAMATPVTERILPSTNSQLARGMDGLIITTGGQWTPAWTRLYDAQTKALEPTMFDIGAQWRNFDTFETQWTQEGGLSLRLKDQAEWQFVTYDTVLSQDAQGNTLYLITRDSGNLCHLAAYDIVTDRLTYLHTYYSQLKNALLVHDGVAYTADASGVNALNIASNQTVANYGAANVAEPMLRVMDRSLLIYEYSDTLDRYQLVSRAELATAQPTPTPTPVPTVQPTGQPYTTLKQGSTGDAVKALQTRLTALGYNAGSADGIFGASTVSAVTWFQDAIGLTQDGIATPELQTRLFAANAPVFEQYVELSRGGRTGIRVTTLQQRLKDLGYAADKVDGVYGTRTQEAVSLFQTENGLRATGVATVETQRKLYSADAAICSSYILLKQGDSGIRVTELQQRLYDLNCFAGPVNGEFGQSTAEALITFCRANGLSDQSQADAALQSYIFSPSAQPASGYIELKYGDTGARVVALQNRLKELGYFVGGATGNYWDQTKESVTLFQQYNGLPATGVATSDTQSVLYSDWAIPYTPAPDPTPEPAPDPTPDPDPTPEPQPHPTPAPSDPDEPHVTDEEMAAMLQWMIDNHGTYYDQNSFIEWLDMALLTQNCITADEFDTRPRGIYGLITRQGVEAFQRENHIGEYSLGFNYGVADEQTLQTLWSLCPDNH